MQSKPSFGKAHIEQAQVHTGQISVWCFCLDLCSPITPRNPRHNGDWSNAEPTRKTTCLHRRVAHKLQQFVNRTFAKPASLNSHYQFLNNDGFGSTCASSFTLPLPPHALCCSAKRSKQPAKTLGLWAAVCRGAAHRYPRRLWRSLCQIRADHLADGAYFSRSKPPSDLRPELPCGAVWRESHARRAPACMVTETSHLGDDPVRLACFARGEGIFTFLYRAEKRWKCRAPR
jgi:hypothetical protein